MKNARTTQGELKPGMRRGAQGRAQVARYSADVYKRQARTDKTDKTNP